METFIPIRLFTNLTISNIDLNHIGRILFYNRSSQANLELL